MSQRLPGTLGLTLGLTAAAAFTVYSPGWAVATAAILAATLLCLHNLPKYALFLLVALVPLDAFSKADTTFVLANSATKLIFVPAFAVLLWERAVGRRPLFGSRQGLWVAGFALALLFSFIMNEYTPFARASLRRYASALLLFFLTLNVIESEKDIRLLFAIIVGSCTLSAALGMLNSLLGWSILLPQEWGGADHGMRLSGASTENPNTFATEMLVALFISLYFMFTTRRKWLRFALYPTAGVLGFSIILSQSRAVTLVLLATGLLLLVLLRKRVRLPALLTALGVLAALLLVLAPPEYFQRMTTLLTERSTDMSLLRRQGYNVIGLKLFASSPLWGIGPGNFPAQIMSEDFRYDINTYGFWSFLHNLYLSMACETGLIGLGFFAALLGSCYADLRRIIRSRTPPADAFLPQAATALLLAFTAFLLSSLFLPNEYQKYLWVMIGLIAAMARLRSKESYEPSATGSAFDSSS